MGGYLDRGLQRPASEDVPLSISFPRGNEDLVLRIVGELARTCGRFVVMLNQQTPRLVATDQR
jgi:hypothetical protein